MSVDSKQIQKLATMSRLTFSDDEITGFAEKFGNILKFVEEIQQANTDGILPLTSTIAGATTPERPDVVTEPNNRDAHQKNAPKAEHGFYAVPKIVE